MKTILWTTQRKLMSERQIEKPFGDAVVVQVHVDDFRSVIVFRTGDSTTFVRFSELENFLPLKWHILRGLCQLQLHRWFTKRSFWAVLLPYLDYRSLEELQYQLSTYLLNQVGAQSCVPAVLSAEWGKPAPMWSLGRLI
jgi:hypothetical protein